MRSIYSIYFLPHFDHMLHLGKAYCTDHLVLFVFCFCLYSINFSCLVITSQSSYYVIPFTLGRLFVGGDDGQPSLSSLLYQVYSTFSILNISSLGKVHFISTEPNFNMHHE